MFAMCLRFGLLSLAASACFAGAALAAGLPKPGDAAPNVIGQTIDGQPFDLSALRGHVVVVNLWATWCPPCRAEMPTLDAFYQAHRSAGLALVGLSADRARDEDDVRRAMRGLSYPVLLLRKAKVNSIGVPTSLPETIVIDRQGIVRAVIAPQDDKPLTADQLEAAVAPLLHAQPVQ